MIPVSVLSWPEILERLQLIFPEGTPQRLECTRSIAAKTVFVMLYVGATERGGTWVRPDQVTRMTDAQSTKTADAERLAWFSESMKPSKGERPGRWYAVNTRESIRDDTLRNGLVQNGAVVERQGLATTSSAGRYALQDSFAALLDPQLKGDALTSAIEAWRTNNLSAAALMRITVMRRGAGSGGGRILVTFPNGETRRMAPGPSSELSKHVLEVFAPRFLKDPAVIFLSESRDKVVERDDALAKKVGLNILASKNLPDIILADLGPAQPELVFVEVVASDGPISEIRKKALLALTDAAGFPANQIRFVTAYFSRSDAPFKKTVDSIAWNSFAWFAAEPELLVELSSDRIALKR